MKKYINAELQVVRVNNNDVIVTSTLNIKSDEATNTWGNGADRFRDWEDF